MKKGIFVTGRVLKSICKVSESSSLVSRYTGLFIVRDEDGTFAISTNGTALVIYRLGAGGKPAGGKFDYADIQILSANERYEIKITARAQFINSPNVSIMASEDCEQLGDWRAAALAMVGGKRIGRDSGIQVDWRDARSIYDVVYAINKTESVTDLSLSSIAWGHEYHCIVRFITLAEMTRDGKSVRLDGELVALAVPRQNIDARSGAVVPEWVGAGHAS